MSFIGTLLRNTRLSRQATNAVKSRTAEAIGNVRNVQRSSTALVEQSAATRTAMGDALSGLEKAGSAATMGGQFARAGLAAAGAGSVMAFNTEFKEKFGDQLSGGANFTFGAVATIGAGAFGLSAITHMGRGISLGHSKFTGFSKTYTEHATALRKGNRELGRAHRGMVGSTKDMHSAVNAARPIQNYAGNARKRGRSAQAIESKIRRAGIDPDNAGRTMMGMGAKGTRSRSSVLPGGNRASHSTGRYGQATRANAAAQKAMNEARRAEAFRTKVTSVSNRAKKTSANAREALGDSRSVLKNLRANKQKLDQFDAYTRASNFSARKLALGVAKMPFAMGGAMLGKGGGMFGGAVDPAMQFMGPAMGIGTISGLAAGTAVGISALRTGNLGRTQGAMQKQQGRSFSNISYNATLHSHRINN